MEKKINLDKLAKATKEEKQRVFEKIVKDAGLEDKIGVAIQD